MTPKHNTHWKANVLPNFSLALLKAASFFGGLLISKNWYLVFIDVSSYGNDDIEQDIVLSQLKLTLSSGKRTMCALHVATILGGKVVCHNNYVLNVTCSKFLACDLWE